MNQRKEKLDHEIEDRTIHKHFSFVFGCRRFLGNLVQSGTVHTAFAPATFLEIGRVMIGNLGTPMSILMPLALLSTLPVLFLLYLQKSMSAFYLTLGGLALFVVALAITLLVNVPIDYK